MDQSCAFGKKACETAEASTNRSRTSFAPEERSSPEQILAARAVFRKDRMAVALLDTIPDSALVLNEKRQIVDANSHVLSLLAVEDVAPLLGLRPGEAFRCIHSADSPGGCGTASACRYCGAVNAVLDCLSTGECCERECQILTSGDRGIALDLLVRAAYVPVDGATLVLAVLRDVSARKRRRVLERVFLHDVLNSVGGIYGLANILRTCEDPQDGSGFADDIYHLAGLVLDEIRAHHKLLQAESGELVPDLATVQVQELVSDVAALYSRHEVAVGKHIAIEGSTGSTVRTDPVLLRRVLGNLLKNALEATEPGGTVSMSMAVDERSVAFAIQNDAVMSDEVQNRIFQLSFSTKASTGRGLGTYSARLFCEGPLSGKVEFQSSAEHGTIFTVTIPRAIASSA